MKVRMLATVSDARGKLMMQGEVYEVTEAWAKPQLAAGNAIAVTDVPTERAVSADAPERAVRRPVAKRKPKA